MDPDRLYPLKNASVQPGRKAPARKGRAESSRAAAQPGGQRWLAENGVSSTPEPPRAAPRKKLEGLERESAALQEQFLEIEEALPDPGPDASAKLANRLTEIGDQIAGLSAELRGLAEEVSSLRSGLNGTASDRADGDRGEDEVPFESSAPGPEDQEPEAPAIPELAEEASPADQESIDEETESAEDVVSVGDAASIEDVPPAEDAADIEREPGCHEGQEPDAEAYLELPEEPAPQIAGAEPEVGRADEHASGTREVIILDLDGDGSAEPEPEAKLADEQVDALEEGLALEVTGPESSGADEVLIAPELDDAEESEGPPSVGTLEMELSKLNGITCKSCDKRFPDPGPDSFIKECPYCNYRYYANFTYELRMVDEREQRQKRRYSRQTFAERLQRRRESRPIRERLTAACGGLFRGSRLSG